MFPLRLFATVVLVSALYIGAGRSAPVNAASATPPVEYPVEMPPIAVAVVRDGLDAHGHWTQTVRLTIRPGGTLADASLVVYADVLHVDALFQAARRQNPRLTNPAVIPSGQTIDLQIDPAAVFILADVATGPDRVVQRFTNGAVNTIYLHPTGTIQRVMTFPGDRPVAFFRYPSSTGPILVRPGGRIVDLSYTGTEGFARVVSDVYGVATYSAAADFTRQTGWDPVHWPPPPGQTRRVITGSPSLYTPRPREVPILANPDPIGRRRQEELHQTRLRVGVYAVRQEGFATTYHVAVTDPQLTASRLSALLFGSPAHRLDLAAKAGFPVPPAGTPAAASFDPPLFGRAFDITVGFEEEQFVVRRRVDPDGATVLLLVNGTRIVTYPDRVHGLLALVRYPTGYKRLLYRPSSLSLAIARGLAYFRLASAPGVPSTTADALARNDAAAVIWRWAPGVPREPGDVADVVQLVDAPAGPVVTVLVNPPPPRTALDELIDRLGLDNPFLASVEVVIVGSAVLLLVGLARERGMRARPRW
jgi:hypothetical protein